MTTSNTLQCGKVGRRGPCRMRLSLSGKCPVHDLMDLSARNSKVAQNFRERDLAAFTAQHSAAGKLGYAKTGIEQWAYATELARQWRLQHPSEPERVVSDLLLQMTGMTAHYDREYIINSDPRAVDFAFPESKCCIEVTDMDGHPTFGRSDKQRSKLEWLASLGWSVYVFHARGNFQQEINRLGQFLHLHALDA